MYFYLDIMYFLFCLLWNGVDGIYEMISVKYWVARDQHISRAMLLQSYKVSYSTLMGYHWSRCSFRTVSFVTKKLVTKISNYTATRAIFVVMLRTLIIYKTFYIVLYNFYPRNPVIYVHIYTWSKKYWHELNKSEN